MIQNFIIKLGGSLIVKEDGIDVTYLSMFHSCIRKHVENGLRGFIIVGGGRTTRAYQQAARDIIHNIPHEDLDWLGIHSTRLNAQLLRTLFKDIADPRVIENYDRKIANWSTGLVIASGWKPGQSTNACAVKLAIDYDIETIINLTNTAYAYDSDPKMNTHAKPLKSLSWEEYKALVPQSWEPGAHFPFDPIAAQEAMKHHKSVIITDGTDLDNLDAILNGSVPNGTVIS